MKHRKEKHVHRVRICQYYVKGVCEFEPEVCWYRHELPSSQTITEFKCSLCGKIANSKPDLMKHRKIEHSEYVPSCLKDKSDTCHFGKEKCWYKHDHKKDDSEEIYNENSEIITRMFDMMEKITERFEFIENQL